MHDRSHCIQADHMRVEILPAVLWKVPAWQLSQVVGSMSELMLPAVQLTQIPPTGPASITDLFSSDKAE